MRSISILVTWITLLYQTWKKKKCPENEYWLEENFFCEKEKQLAPSDQISITVTYYLTLYITLLSDDLENFKLIYLYKATISIK